MANEKETYTIDGNTYEVEVKGERNAVNQKLVINGQEIVLKSGPVLDNSGKTGLGMHIEITAKGDKVTLGDQPYDYYYNGPSKEEIYKVMKERVENGQATSAERLAVYQQQYNNMVKAETVANGKTELDADLLKLTDAQIQGKEPLPNIKDRFPWAYASKLDIVKESVTQYWDEKAAHNVKCREQLKKMEKMPYFDDARRDGNTIKIKDHLAQNDTHDALSNQRLASEVKGRVATGEELDNGTQRLVAAANTKAAQKEAEARATNHQAEVINRTNDYDRA